ncbi:MAG: CDP-glycerol glycerophosphotransferase family protein [Clostridia bacterium]|nr:CDP-glycerol glycerophosphotransferase family protein [Clostridia bacterium]
MSFIEKLKLLRLKLYIFLFRCRKLENNKIIFWANNFKHFGDSPKYIALYLLKHYPGKFDLVWIFENGKEIPEDLPEGIRVVKYFSLDYLRELHTAKFVICNARTGQGHMWYKRKGQRYIQTWHSSLRLKKIEGDAPTLPQSYVEAAKADSKKIDLLLSGCEFSTNIFKNAFWYSGEIAKFGTPRSDVLINGSTETKEKVFEHYGIAQNNKLLLYAPTFRDNKNADIFGMDFEKLSSTLAKGENNWSVGCRLHPNITDNLSNEFAISMSKYSDMQELVAAADILITDYSSCMFDMAVANKLCILYAPDLQSYTSNERGLYFDISELPFPIAKNMDELLKIIENFDNKQYESDLKAFMNKIGSYEDGNASKMVAEYIIKNTNK